MRIAQVSPLYESVPPKCYGGTERIVSILTETLNRAGHEVTLFASGESFCSGRLIPCARRSLREELTKEPMASHLYMFERVKALAEEFDVIHFHTEYLHFGSIRGLSVPTVTTLHGRLDRIEYGNLFHEFRDVPLVSISFNQRKPLPFQNWMGNVYHGLPKDTVLYTEKPQGYLAFLGRISPEKGIEDAIEIAKKTGLKLKVAAKIDEADREYAHSLQPLLRSPWVEYIGEIGDREKPEFLGGAHALLFPVQWPEPFGLVMIESLAAGTPVVAYRAGSVPEVIRNESTGFIVDTIEGACEAVDKIVYRRAISRRACRRDFEARFTVERMAREYEHIYRRLIREKRAERDKAAMVFDSMGAGAEYSGRV